jgi:ectoine hydroxylase-related dioxygenase (phytanoyl-CoA dioxygenase family)
MIHEFPAPIADGTALVFGDDTFTFGKDAAELTDSSPLLGDFDALRARLAEDGYLFIRGFHPRDLALRAAKRTLDAIAAQGGLETNSAVDEGRATAENRSFAFFRDLPVSHSPEVLAVTNGAHTFAFYEGLFGKPALTFDKKWLRAMAHGGNNFFHYDSAYVGRGTSNRCTMWSALSDIGLENGPLIVCLGSHRDQRLINTYGQIDMDRDLADAVFSKSAREMVDDFGFTMATAHFQPGDVILFGMHFMHSSIPNRTNRYRISIDTRYQPADEEKDDRFFGENGTWIGNFSNKEATYRPMEEMRKEWGLSGKSKGEEDARS